MADLDTGMNLSTSRRTLVRGAAWSVPVVAIAATAPAYAASPCVSIYTYALDWGNTAKTTYAPPAGSSTTKVGTASALAPTGSGAAALGVTFTSKYIAARNTPDRRADDNLTVPTATNIGGLGATVQGLLISHASTGDSRDAFRQTVDIHFARAVTGLSFTITDVDSATNAWWDRVELTGSRSGTFSGTVLTGDGTQGNPWRTIDANNSIATNSSDGNVKVTYGSLTTDALTDITLTFWSSVSGGNQLIRLTDFAFKAKGC